MFLGSNIACGCHAAVYELRVNDDNKKDTSAACSTVATTSAACESDFSEVSVKERLSVSTIYSFEVLLFFKQTVIVSKKLRLLFNINRRMLERSYVCEFLY